MTNFNVVHAQASDIFVKVVGTQMGWSSIFEDQLVAMLKQHGWTLKEFNDRRLEQFGYDPDYGPNADLY